MVLQAWLHHLGVEGVSAPGEKQSSASKLVARRCEAVRNEYKKARTHLTTKQWQDRAKSLEQSADQKHLELRRHRDHFFCQPWSWQGSRPAKMKTCVAQ